MCQHSLFYWWQRWPRVRLGWSSLRASRPPCRKDLTRRRQAIVLSKNNRIATTSPFFLNQRNDILSTPRKLDGFDGGVWGGVGCSELSGKFKGLCIVNTNLQRGWTKYEWVEDAGICNKVTTATWTQVDMFQKIPLNLHRVTRWDVEPPVSWSTAAQTSVACPPPYNPNFKILTLGQFLLDDYRRLHQISRLLLDH